MKSRFDPLKIWTEQAELARRSATRYTADALVASHPAERIALMTLAESSERYAAKCERRVQEYTEKN